MDRVTPETLPDAVAFLEQNPELAMFPLANLAQFGLDGDHPYAPRIWVDRAAGQVTGALVITRNHTVMPLCAPSLTHAMMQGRKLFRLIGPAQYCRPLVDQLGLPKDAAILNRDEPQSVVELDKLDMPDTVGSLVPLQNADPQTIIDWRAEYLIEALGEAPDTAARQAKNDYEEYVADNSHRALVDNGRALSMTGFNAVLPEIVQVGGVYTPKHLRRHGYARRAVALHLAQARAQGVRKATLFSANAHAQRAYEAIGFKKIGDWTLFLLPEAFDV